jgi:hypothetical protein
MEKCINCNKEFKIRGIKLHRNKCDQLYILLRQKEQEKKEKEDKKIKIVFSYDKQLNIGNYLPQECIKIIYDYLSLLDNHTTYFKLYNNINNVSLVSKNFYFAKPNINYMKEKIKIEIKEKICRSWSINNYGLTSTDLENLDYKIISRGMYGKIHAFNIIDIKEFAYIKYGTEYDYKNYLHKNKLILSSTSMKNMIYKKRRDIYEKLFLKYDNQNNSYIDELYEYYQDYIKKGIPRIETIENEIKKAIEKKNLKQNLMIELNKKNIEYYKNKHVLGYLYGYNMKKDYSLKIEQFSEIINKCDINTVIDSLNNRMKKKEIFLNLNKSEYSTLAYQFINDCDKDINCLINLIKNIEIIREYMDSEKNIIINSLTDELCVVNYINNVINNWFNKNKENDYKEYEYFYKLDKIYQEKIKNKYLIYGREKEKLERKKLHMENAKINMEKRLQENIAKYKLYIEKGYYINNIECICNQIGSPKCINFLCTRCCNDTNCTRHYKKRSR